MDKKVLKQVEDKTTPSKNKRNIVVRIVAFLLIFLLIQQGLNFLLLPNVSYFRQTAHDVKAVDDVYQVISVGSSEELYTFNSLMATELLHENCFNMGSAGTTMCGGIYSSFRLAMKHQNPNLVIIMFSAGALDDDKEHGAAYAGIAPYTGDFGVNTEYFVRNCLDGGAFKRMFPWSVHHSNNLSEVKENVSVKLSEAYRAYDASILPAESLVYKGQGYCPQLPGTDNNNVISYKDVDLSQCIDPATGTFALKEAEFQSVQTEALIRMIELSHKQGADVLIAMSPVTRSNMVKSGKYDSAVRQIQKLAEDHGADFVNLNYAKASFYDPQPYEYVDDFHVVEEGADRYTKALCEYILMTRAGQDTTDLFYPDWGSFVQSVDWDLYKGLE